MSVPESVVMWAGAYGYAINSLALIDNDAEPGLPMSVRELFAQKIMDMAKCELQRYHIGGGLWHERWEWQDPINDERVPGSKAC